jgi:hypothetical protein
MRHRKSNQDPTFIDGQGDCKGDVVQAIDGRDCEFDTTLNDHG